MTATASASATETATKTISSIFTNKGDDRERKSAHGRLSLTERNKDKEKRRQHYRSRQRVTEVLQSSTIDMTNKHQQTGKRFIL